MRLRQFAISLLLLTILFLSGCVISPNLNGRNGNGSGGGGTTGVGHLFVSNQSGNEIISFAHATADSGNNLTPTAIITGLSSPAHIFSDGANDRLYVVNSGAANILVFNSVSTLTGTAAVTPTRTISSQNLANPISLALDTTRDLLYVADTNEIAVFSGASGANGTVAASAIIQPGFTPSALLVNAATDTLFVANSGGNAVDILANAHTLSGTINSTPILSGTNTGLNQPAGLQIDGAGRLIVSNAAGASINIYANAVQLTGNTAPVTVINGNQTTLSTPGQLAIDPTTNAGELYVADSSAGQVAVFSNITTAQGNPINAAPNRKITGLTTLRGVAIDTTH
jgi:sugar lactone lactonase YvrE